MFCGLAVHYCGEERLCWRDKSVANRRLLCITDVAYYCIPQKGLDLVFSFKLFHTLGFETLGKGVKPGLSRKEAYVLPIAIPPLAEQHRIVAKVDELMALCDRLEAAQGEREQRRDRLVAASLHRIRPAHAPPTRRARSPPSRERARFTSTTSPASPPAPSTSSPCARPSSTSLSGAACAPRPPSDEPSCLELPQDRGGKVDRDIRRDSESPIAPVQCR